jgi:predicted tellurium resistance membrane protein TerC
VETKRIVFVLANVVASLMWLRFLVRLIQQWNLMKPDIRDAAGIFMVFFCLLWLTIIRDKKGYLSLAMAFGILATVYRIVWILMKNPGS